MSSRAWVRVAAMWMSVLAAQCAWSSATPPEPKALHAAVAPVALPLPDDAAYARQWILHEDDNDGMPFAIVDKKDARLFLFDAAGRSVGSTSVLLGEGPGDRSIPGIERRDVTRLKAAERITPAGRFVSQPGHNNKGEDIVWVDYPSSIAIHRLRPAAASQHRPARLASNRASDKRISAGCVVVPVAFYDRVVSPTLGHVRGVVYVLPEARPVRAMFGAMSVSLRTH